MIVSGFGFIKETMVISEESEDAFPKATPACVKKCGAIQHGITGLCLANAFRVIAEKDRYNSDQRSLNVNPREKPLEVIKIDKLLSPPTPPKLVSLPLSPKKSLQDRFNNTDNRMMAKCCGNEELFLSIERKKDILKTGKLKFHYRKEVNMA